MIRQMWLPCWLDYQKCTRTNLLLGSSPRGKACGAHDFSFCKGRCKLFCSDHAAAAPALRLADCWLCRTLVPERLQDAQALLIKQTNFVVSKLFCLVSFWSRRFPMQALCSLQISSSRVSLSLSALSLTLTTVRSFFCSGVCAAFDFQCVHLSLVIFRFAIQARLVLSAA